VYEFAIECVNDWTSIVQDKSSVTVAYVDFSMAFDTVSHANFLLAYMHMAFSGLC